MMYKWRRKTIHLSNQSLSKTRNSTSQPQLWSMETRHTVAEKQIFMKVFISCPTKPLILPQLLLSHIINQFRNPLSTTIHRQKKHNEKNSDFIPRPGTIITGAALQLWKQYSLTLPCNTLDRRRKKARKVKNKQHTVKKKKKGGKKKDYLCIRLRPLVPMITATGFTFSATLQIALPASPSTIRVTIFTCSRIYILMKSENYRDIVDLIHTGELAS